MIQGPQLRFMSIKGQGRVGAFVMDMENKPYRPKNKSYVLSIAEKNVCLVCEKEFIGLVGAVTCCKSCSGKQASQLSNAQRISKPCATCGKLVEGSPSRFRSKSNLVYCDRACANERYVRYSPFTDLSVSEKQTKKERILSQSPKAIALRERRARLKETNPEEYERRREADVKRLNEYYNNGTFFEQKCKHYIHNHKQRYKEKPPSDLTPKYLEDLWYQQNKICALSVYTGHPFKMRVDETRKRLKPTLDQKEAGKGYYKGNVQWTIMMLNLARQDDTIDQWEEAVQWLSGPPTIGG